MSKNWTQAQRQAIETRGCSVLVSAAAGSGKTTVLVERVTQMILHGEVSADRLLIVTFTNAAATSMKKKILDSIAVQLALQPDNRELQRQQILLYQAKICTIDSYCLDLARTYFHLLDIPPDFRLADDADMQVMKKEAMDSVLEEFYASHAEEMDLLYDFFCFRSDQALISLVDRLFEFTRAMAFPEKWYREQLQRYKQEGLADGWRAALEDELSQRARQLQSLADLACKACQGDDKLEKAYLPLMLEYRTFADRVSAASHDLDGVRQVLNGFEKGRLGIVRKASDPTAQQTVKDARDAFVIQVEQMREIVCSDMDDYETDRQALLPVLDTLIRLARRYEQALYDIKKERALFHFSDIVHFAIQLTSVELEDGEIARTPLCRELSAGYDAIFIDEYQDINAVQDMLFTLLSRDEENLFIVGDVKQSIYRFRNANPQLFLDKKARFQPFGTPGKQVKIVLGENFRSREEVTDFVNFLFGRIMSPRTGELVYGEEEQLIPAAQYPQAPDRICSIDVIRWPASGQEMTASQAQAVYVAQEIVRMLREGYPVADRIGGTLRPCRPSDFCILLRSVRGRAELYVDALTQAGVGVWSDTDQGYFSAVEVRIMLNLLRILDNPLSDAAFVSVMASPMFLFNDDELARIRLLGRDKPMYLCVEEASRLGDAKASDFLCVLRKLRTFAVRNSVEALIREIYDETDFLPVMQAWSPWGSEQIRANLRLLLDYAASFAGRGSSGLSGFVRYLDSVMEQGGDLKGVNIVSETADVVKIMSIHHSKGLEFPIVFLPDCSKRFNLDDVQKSDVLLDDALGIGLRRVERENLKKFSTLPRQAIACSARQKQLSEEMRVLYVALTRAQEKLILVASEAKPEEKMQRLSLYVGEDGSIDPMGVSGASSYADWLWMACSSAVPGAPFTLRFIEPSEIIARATEQPQEEARPLPQENLVRQVRAAASYRYPFETQVRIPAKLAVTELVGGAHTGTLTRPTFSREDRFTATDAGNAVHHFMQFADYVRAAKDVEAEVDRLKEMQLLSKQEAEHISVPRLIRFFESPLANRILSAQCVYREFKFLTRIPAEQYLRAQGQETCGGADGAEIFIQGIADCVFEEDGKRYIVDYKTDVVSSVQELALRYAPQLRLYRKAVEESLGAISGCILYAFHLGQQIQVD